MQSALTGQAVFDALISDEQFTSGVSMDADVIALHQPYIEASPEILAEFLPLELSFDSYSNVRIAFLTHLGNNGYAEKAADLTIRKGEATESQRELAVTTIQQHIATEILMAKAQSMADTMLLLQLEVMGFDTIEKVLRNMPAALLF